MGYDKDLRIRMKKSDGSIGSEIYIDKEMRVFYRDRIISTSKEKILEIYSALVEEISNIENEEENCYCWIALLNGRKLLKRVLDGSSR